MIFEKPCHIHRVETILLHFPNSTYPWIHCYLKNTAIYERKDKPKKIKLNTIDKNATVPANVSHKIKPTVLLM